MKRGTTYFRVPVSVCVPVSVPVPATREGPACSQEVLRLAALACGSLMMTDGDGDGQGQTLCGSPTTATLLQYGSEDVGARLEP